MKIQKGKWYMIRQYGVDFNVKARAVDVCKEFITVKLFCGYPIRSREVVHVNDIIGECERPNFFKNK